MAGSRRLLRRLAPVCLIWLALGLNGCDFPGRPNRADRPLPSNEVVDFDVLYAAHCSACHGAEGNLGPAPPLNDPLFLSLVPDDVLLSLVAEGRRRTPMPGFSRRRGGPLTDAQVKALAQGIKPRWQTGEATATQSTAGDAPSYRPREADRQQQLATGEHGRQLFARACAECHGAQGMGGDMAGAIHDRAFLSLVSDQALRRLIITGRPDLGMPNFAETDGRDSDFRPLTSDDVDALVALLAAWRNAEPEPKLGFQPHTLQGFAAPLRFQSTGSVLARGSSE
jgi:mono/diheme cytochrome c family protein